MVETDAAPQKSNRRQIFVPAFAAVATLTVVLAGVFITLRDSDERAGRPSSSTSNAASSGDTRWQLSCPESEQQHADVDISGPGTTTPAEAVALLGSEGHRLITEVDGQGTEAVVYAIADKHRVVRRYTLIKRPDGWWPQDFVECAGT